MSYEYLGDVSLRSEWPAIRSVQPGVEFECDRAKVTEDKVLVRKDGIWIELQPTNPACLK